MSIFERLKRGVSAALLDEDPQSDVRADSDPEDDFRADSFGVPVQSAASTADTGNYVLTARNRSGVAISRVTQQWAMALYRSGGIARRVIDIVPHAATRAGGSVNTHDQTNIMATEDKRLNVWTRMFDGMSQGRRDGGCVVLLVTTEKPGEGGQPPKLSDPLDLDNVISLDAVRVFARDEVSVDAYFSSDLRSTNYGRSNLITISPVSGGQVLIVHYSRILWFPGRYAGEYIRALNGGWDDTWYESIVDALYRVEAVSASGATHASRLVIPTATIKNSRNKMAGKDGATWRDKMTMMLRMMSNVRGVVIPEGDTFGLMSASIAGFKDLDENAKSILCASEGIAQTILFGQAPGGLSTDDASAKSSFDTLVSSQQEHVLREQMEYLYRVIFNSDEGPTNGVEPDDWQLVFNPLAVLSETQTVANRKMVADTDAIYMQSGVYDADDVRASRFDGSYSIDMINIEPVEEIGAAEEE